MARPRTTRLAAVAAGAALAGGALLATAPSALAAAYPTPVPSVTTVTAGDTFTMTGAGCFAPEGSVYAAEVYAGGSVDARYFGFAEVADDGTWTMEVHTEPSAPSGEFFVNMDCDWYTNFSGYPSVPMMMVAKDAATPPNSSTPAPTTSPAPTSDAPAPTSDAPAPTSDAPAPATVSTDASGRTTITATPGQTLTPQNPLRIGASVRLRFPGFRPGEKVTLVLHSKPIALGTFTADAQGVLVVPFTVPAGAESGHHRLLATDASGNVFEYPLEIAAASGKSGDLAYTGADPTAPLIGGVALLTIGGGLLLVSRRRRSTGAQV